jgi:hypothetical protein
MLPEIPPPAGQWLGLSPVFKVNPTLSVTRFANEVDKHI